VVHADVKLENCLFANDQIDSLQLVDFGLSLNIRDCREIPDGIRGTLNYMAPEILLADQGKPIMPQISYRTDVWAAGVIFFTLSMGFLPFNGTTQLEVIQQMTAPEYVIVQRLTSFPKWWQLNAMLQDLILKMLKVDPNQRLSSSQALQHPWFMYQRNQKLTRDRMNV
jgi:serine/threonine protein kinase